MKTSIVHAGQRVITQSGQVVTVAVVSKHGIPYAWGWRGLVPVVVVGDAFGGEHDQTLGLAA